MTGPEPSSLKCRWRVAAAVGDHRNGKVCGMGGKVHDFDVEDGGEAAKALGADAEAVDLVVELDAKLFDLGPGGRGR